MASNIGNKAEWRDQLSWIIIGVLTAVFIALFGSWQLGFFSLLFMATAWWVWEQPEKGLLLLIVIAPILPMLKITQTIGTATLIKDIIIITLFTRQFVRPLLRQTLPYRPARLIVPIVALWGWTAIEAVRADNGWLLGVLRARDIVLYSLLYFGVLYLPYSKRAMRQRLTWLLASTAVLLGLAVYQWWWAQDSAVLRFDPVREVWIPRISSILAHPSIFGQYMVGVALLLGVLGIYTRKKINRVWWLIAWLVTLPFIWLTYSRAVWIGMAAGTGLAAMVIGAGVIRGKMSRAAVLKIAVALIAVVAIGVVGLGKYTPAGVYFRSFIDPNYASNEERLLFMARLIAPMTNVEAMVGKGLGDVMTQNFRDNDLKIYDIATGNSRDVQLTKNQTLVDNQYIKTWVEMGLVGWIIYGWIYWVLFKTCWRAMKQDAAESKTIGAWGLGWLAAFAVQALFIDIWDIWPTNAMFWVVAALAGVSWTAGNRSQVEGRFSPDKGS